MCGICGIVHRDPDFQVSERALVAMRDALSHRGPDDAGHVVEPGVGLASRRLAILDLSERGHMPMTTPEGRYSIVYNGEVYNYRDLRPRLVSSGVTFQSNTDTEVLLRLFERDGPSMLDRLNGMFAIAIWDREQRSLFLARDRLGVKPLYYVVRGGALYFASEEKALFAAGVTRQFNPEAWEELLCFRYVAGDRTAFAGVSRLLPGHSLLWRNGVVTITRWWSLGDRVEARRTDLPRDPSRWFRETFDDSVGLRRISDVPVGVLLSGGLDSGSVAASLASHAGEGVASFTVTFPEPGFDESGLAREVAERWNLEAHEVVVEPAELADRLAEASWFNDAPLAHASDLHLLAIARHAKPRVTVLLSGEGADEFLGGYVRYAPLRSAALLNLARGIMPSGAARRLGGRVGKLAKFLALGSNRDLMLLNACEITPPELDAIGMRPSGHFPFRERILNEAARVYPGDLRRQTMYSDQHTFLCSLLDRNDKMTMAASIECRVPFLDYRLVETLAALPSSTLFAGYRQKQLLRDAVGHRLPASVLHGRKWGFGVPWSDYLLRDPACRELVATLPEMAAIADGPFDRAKVRTLVAQFLRHDKTPATLVTQLLMVAAWYQVGLNSFAPGADASRRKRTEPAPLLWPTPLSPQSVVIH